MCLVLYIPVAASQNVFKETTGFPISNRYSIVHPREYILGYLTRKAWSRISGPEIDMSYMHITGIAFVSLGFFGGSLLLICRTFTFVDFFCHSKAL